MRCSGPSSKKFSSRVRPGVLLVRARPWRCDDGVDGARLAGVRAPGERDLRSAVGRKLGGLGRGKHEMDVRETLTEGLRKARGSIFSVVYNSPPFAQVP